MWRALFHQTMNKTIITMLLVLITLAGQAKEKSQVWDNPTTEYGNAYGDGATSLSLDITKVELKDTETVVYITARQISFPGRGNWFRFAGDTYLKAGDRRYALTKADGIELDTETYTGKDCKRDMAFHFQPLPLGTRSFDFIEGDGDRAFQFRGVKPVEERWKQLFPSYWRDPQTGDWKIAFFDDCAIYDCRFWTYRQRDVNPKTGEAELLLTNGADELKVTVGKNKKGTRTMEIGGRKAVLAMMNSRYVPDYPTKDTRTSFADTGYREDTVTVVGWLKDMPEELKRGNTFEFTVQNFFTDDEESVYADMDSLGRFTAKIPVLNSSEFYCDWGRSYINTILEAGKTYFMLCDYKEGRRYFMGDDCRLQNELAKSVYDWRGGAMFQGNQMLDELRSEERVTPERLDRYVASVDSLLKSYNADVDAHSQAQPTLSTRFNLIVKGLMLWNQARELGQARFMTKDFQLSASARSYAHDTFWTKLDGSFPYTLYRDLRTFVRDYLDDAERGRNSTFTVSYLDLVDEIASNDEELALLNRWKDWLTDAQAKVMAAPTDEEKQKIAEELNEKNADLIKSAEKILNTPKASKLVRGHLLNLRLKDGRKTLDSLHTSPFIKDIYLSKMVYDEIDHSRTALSPAIIDTLRAMTANPLAIAQIEKLNDRYLAIENREFDKLVLKSSDNLADLSEGEALLKKIIEPYKGKFVLLDIWGTWCGPCKEALSHSTEEYARLKDFDIEFLYLANSSPQTSWENVIKEYNVSGPNVAHYNLPTEQQSAIERHLDVHSWPTYKLFDRNGNLLDLKVDARDLENLARLLEQMK